MTCRMLTVVVVLASALAVGCGGQARKEQRGAAAKSPRAAPVTIGPGRIIDIGGGRTLYLQCVGSGSPAVVLEAGFGADTFQWRDVQPQLGRTTRTCAYDRAGFGRSIARRGVRDARDEIADLQRLLRSARIEPPYVLVGHSYGGVLARVFAARHPTETAGLVLIDTMGRQGRQRQLAIWPRSQAPAIRRELATTVMDGVDLAPGEALASRITTLADMPLAVITAGRHDNFRRTPARLGRALTRLWDTMQDGLGRLSDNSLHVVALDSDHDVPSSHTGQPSVVIRAVQAVVVAARDHTRIPPCRRLFSGPDIRCRS